MTNRADSVIDFNCRLAWNFTKISVLILVLYYMYVESFHMLQLYVDVCACVACVWRACVFM